MDPLENIYNMEITITGLTPAQVNMANEIWQFDTYEEIQQFKSTLSTEDLITANTVESMIIAAVLDHIVDVEPEIIGVLDQFTLHGLSG
mgnify:CR=1 FL=1